CKPAKQRRLPRGILTKSGRDNVAHDALVDLLRLQIRPLDCFAHRDRAQLWSGYVAQTSLKFSDGRAASRDDYNIIRSGHGCAPRRSLGALLQAIVAENRLPL